VDRTGPYPFTQRDLEAERLAVGVAHTLADFYRWRDRNAAAIADHVDRYTRHLEAARARYRPVSLLSYRLSPRRRRAVEREQIAREVAYFGLYNLAELFDPQIVECFTDAVHRRLPVLDQVLDRLDATDGAAGLVASLARQVPAVAELPETVWLADRLERLYRRLPEAVVRAGSMGKVIRTIAGVLAIGAYDTRDAGPAARREHLARILPGAYAYGAAYAIVDDTFHDLRTGHLTQAERDRLHAAVLECLTTGRPADLSRLPDHPLVDEADELFRLMLGSYPFERYRHLYHAAHAMYLAQHRDAELTVPDAVAAGLTALYPDLFVKAGLSRVVANILGRRELDDAFYTRCLNTIFRGQLRDDLRDEAEDRAGGRLTPFTFPADRADTNPLYDMFAYDAYVVHEVYGGDPLARESFAFHGAGKLATHLAADRDGAAELMRRYDTTAEIARFLRTAAGLPRRVASRLDSFDMRLKQRSGDLLRHRGPTTVDCLTFVTDRLPYLEEVTRRGAGADGRDGLHEVVAYALGGRGKRLRPALTLMLAEGLGVSYRPIEPLLAAGELFHTASLVFDDLPAQDNATMRRGRPAAHVAFDEAGAQLAALSMISTGFGLLARLTEHFPADRVTEVIGYLGSVLGPERLCRGQHLDLRLGTDGAPVTGERILEMYRLKTSTSLEAALVPLAMLLERPEPELAALRRYAEHAGIVFQLRDDILDLTATPEVVGKDTGNDVGKVNAVRVYGLAEAERLMWSSVDAAVAACADMPFDTALLEGMVRYFATRSR